MRIRERHILFFLSTLLALPTPQKKNKNNNNVYLKNEPTNEPTNEPNQKHNNN